MSGSVQSSFIDYTMNGRVLIAQRVFLSISAISICLVFDSKPTPLSKDTRDLARLFLIYSIVASNWILYSAPLHPYKSL